MKLITPHVEDCRSFAQLSSIGSKLTKFFFFFFYEIEAQLGKINDHV